ncbi:MAG: hypothetical protein ACRD5J_08425 [Nitrososphaeraceae archaeon]
MEHKRVEYNHYLSGLYYIYVVLHFIISNNGYRYNYRRISGRRRRGIGPTKSKISFLSSAFFGEDGSSSLDEITTTSYGNVFDAFRLPGIA